MALIVCHSLKGGIGTTFLSAHLATGLAEAGADVTVLTVAGRDTLSLHFGIVQGGTLPGLTAPSEDAVVVGGIDLRHYAKAPQDPDFVPMLRELGYLHAGPERVLIVDVPATEYAFAGRIAAHACMQLCPLDAAPDTVALLPQMFDESSNTVLSRTAFVINRLDDTRRLSRHNAAFIRELTGARLLGRVRFDESVPEAIAMQKSLAKYAPSSAALADVTRISALVAPTIMNAVSTWNVPETASRAA